jgi:hypothetical protein
MQAEWAFKMWLLFPMVLQKPIFSQRKQFAPVEMLTQKYLAQPFCSITPVALLPLLLFSPVRLE